MNTSKKISPLNKLLAGTAGIMAFGLGLSFIFNWVITKIMTQEEVGFFQYFISLITFGMVIIPLGYHSLIQREANKLGPSNLKLFKKETFITILIITSLFSVIWAYGVIEMEWVLGLKDYTGLYISIGILPVYSLVTFYRALLQGQNKVYWSVIPEVVFRPLLLLVACIIFYLVGFEPKAYHLLWILLGILVLVLIPSILQSFKELPQDPLKEKPIWLKQALTLLPISLLYTINERIDIVMISKHLGPTQNAIYGIAFKFAAFAGFGLVILNAVMVPIIAKHFNSSKDHSELESLIKPAVRKALAVSAIIGAVLIFFGEDVLGLFGKPAENYFLGHKSLIILIIGQIFNVAVGSVGYILTMAKLEKLSIISIIISILINVVLNYILLPVYGIEGAAIATAIAMITWNGLMLIFVKVKTGLNPTIF